MGFQNWGEKKGNATKAGRRGKRWWRSGVKLRVLRGYVGEQQLLTRAAPPGKKVTETLDAPVALTLTMPREDFRAACRRRGDEAPQASGRRVLCAFFCDGPPGYCRG
jgi:hypothetical protein